MKIKDGFILRDLAGKTFVVAVGDRSKEFKGMISLNETGKFIWKLLEIGATKDEVIEKLLNDFNNTYYLEEYRKYQYLKNKEVVISTLKEEFIGTYYDIDELGGLVINLSGDLKTFYNGEVIKTKVYENK